jgi:hypothetical protein
MTFTVKLNPITVNGVQVADEVAAKLVRHADPVKFLKDGIIVNATVYTLPGVVAIGLWKLLNQQS